MKSMSLFLAAASASAVAIGSVAVGCGSTGDPAAPRKTMPAGAEAASTNDAGDAAAPREELATGTRIVSHPALLAGLTADGFVAFSDVDANGHSVAKVIPVAGGDETMLVASAGTGKADLRFAIDGKVVFVWSDRGNRVANLTVWSKASGVVTIGAGVRPGRAAASPDGNAILYMRDITATTANVVTTRLGGDTVVVGTMNAADDDCWRDADLAAVGARLVARYCPSGTTTFGIRTLATDGTGMTDLSLDADSARYAASRIVWRERSGALKAAAPDGTGVVALAATTAEFVWSRDQSVVAFRTDDGAIARITPDGGPTAGVVGPGAAIRLGAISPHGAALLFASKAGDAGTDVKGISFEAGAPVSLVTAATSCASCLYDSFSKDETRALVVDPIDDSPAAGGVGPVRVLDLSTATPIATFGARVITAAALDGDAGIAARFAFVDALPDATLSNGYAYGITTRGLETADDTTVIARGVENLEIDLTGSQALFSFSTPSDHAGIWTAPLR